MGMVFVYIGGLAFMFLMGVLVGVNLIPLMDSLLSHKQNKEQKEFEKRMRDLK